MQPFKLTALRQSDESAPSIRVYTRSSMKKLATIWGDGTITFSPEIDYEIEEIKAIMELQEHFFTIYNSIIDKDEEIRELNAENKQLQLEVLANLNPVIERQ